LYVQCTLDGAIFLSIELAPFLNEEDEDGCLSCF